jgi:ribosomal protein L37AE/L43A
MDEKLKRYIETVSEVRLALVARYKAELKDEPTIGSMATSDMISARDLGLFDHLRNGTNQPTETPKAPAEKPDTKACPKCLATAQKRTAKTTGNEYYKCQNCGVAFSPDGKIYTMGG